MRNSAPQGVPAGAFTDIRQVPGRINRPGAGGDGAFAKALGQAAAQNRAAQNRTTQNRAAQIKLTKHAESRLRERNIDLSESQREKIASALERADGKGVRDALVMLDGIALVANTRSKTVITAIGESDLQNNIFTNIDGAVFA